MCAVYWKGQIDMIGVEVNVVSHGNYVVDGNQVPKLVMN